MIEIDGQEWPTINLAEIRNSDPKILIKEYNSHSKIRINKNKLTANRIHEKVGLSLMHLDNSKEWQEYTLDDFTFYSSNVDRPHSLNSMLARMRFKGTITDSIGRSVKVHSGEVTTRSLTGMTDDSKDLKVWLRSSTLKDEIYYLLKKPSQAYKPLFEDFLWSVRLSKIILSFLKSHPNATLEDTKYEGILNEHVYKEYPEEPWAKWNLFPHIIENALNIIDHIFYLCEDIPDEIISHQFWNNSLFEKIQNKLSGNPIKPPLYKDELTAVTPEAHTFYSPIFNNFLKLVKHKDSPKVNIKELPAASAVVIKDIFREQKMQNKYRVLDSNLWCLEDPLGFRNGCAKFNKVLVDTEFIHVGDCVQLRNDNNEIWIARVTSIFYTNPKNPLITIHWLYKSCDTLLESVSNRDEHFSKKELWYTHHCECESSEELSVTAIYRKVNVKFNSNWCPDKLHHYFCQSFYSHLNAWFEGLKPTHLKVSDQCQCQPLSFEDSLAEFKKRAVGDLVYLNHLHPTLLTLHEIVSLTDAAVELRPLLLIDQLPKEHISSCLPHNGRQLYNEVVYSKKTVNYSIAELVQGAHLEYIDTAHLEFYDPYTPLPNNLAHNGAGHHYYFNKVFDPKVNILSPLTASDEFGAKYPPWKPSAKKLATLDLFCGGGSFGHGLEDAGVAECKWAVDVCDPALDTYSINTKGSHTVYYESVNKLLKETINNNPRPNWPITGEVDFIIAGNPCQGFSRMNHHNQDPSSIKKSALLASVASYIEHYRPRFFLIENVANLTRFQYQHEKGSKGLFPFNQTIGLFVKLGYQVRWGVIDAASHGLPQARNRVFIWGAASGENLPQFPMASHVKLKKGLWGKGVSLPSGLRSDSVIQDNKTAFQKMTIKRAIEDLPSIPRKRKFPSEWADHETLSVGKDIQDIINIIPVDPVGLGLLEILKLYPKHPSLNSTYVDRLKKIKKKNPGNKFRDLKRVNPDNVIATVTTSPSFRGVQSVPAIHYSEARLLSLREYARAQGFLDTDVIIGPLRNKHRIVGNAVARPVAFALGLNVKV
ncbi:hypothetical protein J3Q64DRAFT_1718489 [Phycomyces blakesleeanus]|uniref:Cytosine-specific methyltransferase n=2 Tax=Phycomyces blakesleeanus TaxID=4837 RepID=A0A167PXZ4_PHYB8|nr:hypothetical protein PHYBLDRAFT_77038 [Phycomyces blakesleeanus NRRL 1555(-)]OAD78747.1 hypothetical protein PHYBLDRAFT_77038 [Phycomyces blakesleeanus NRRL 1555(-)]|eukprot:XP_018296787.1 hypothetical protein PHYBLDRAFT_77038 [Phycomyces blakesleeanus NRRL 1555(-)]